MSIKIGFLTHKNPYDKRSWSGTHYYMLKALEREQFNVIVLGPLPIPGFLDKVLGLLDSLSQLFTLKRYNRDNNILLSVYWAYKLKKRIHEHSLDILFAPAASTEIAFLNTKIPICYYTDASFFQLNNYYKYYSDFSKVSEKESGLIEKKAIGKSRILIYPSQWAANYVQSHFNIDKQIFIIKFGANLDLIPLQIPEKKGITPFNLLFIGVDWERKGGYIVYETFKILLRRGKNVYLTVCGCLPPETHPKVRVVPFIDKNVQFGEEKLSEILTQSHVFFLPTRAECFGIVFCEASAYGLPSVTTDTGGVSSAVEDGVNGYVLSLAAKPEDYADKIQILIDNPELFSELSKSTRKKYEDELNWDLWGVRMKKIITSCLEDDKVIQGKK